MNKFKIIFLTYFLFFGLFSFSKASSDPPICGTSATTAINLSQTGGIFRPSQGS